MNRTIVNKRILVCLCAFLCAALLSAEAPQGADRQKAEALAKELMEVSGGGELGTQIMAQMVGSFKQAHPDIPSQFWDEFMAAANPEEIEKLVVPIYVEILTIEEMAAAVAYYKTPEGRSMVQKMPLIVQQSMQIGQQWGMNLAQEAARKVEEFRQQEQQQQ